MFHTRIQMFLGVKHMKTFKLQQHDSCKGSFWDLILFLYFYEKIVYVLYIRFSHVLVIWLF